MQIASDDVPQADVLDDVIKVVQAVNEGFRSYQDIGEYIGKDERNGRYYRLASEILGLTEKPQRNVSVLTQLGRQFLDASDTQRNEMLPQLVLNTRMMQRMLPFLEQYPEGVTRNQIETFIENVTDVSGSTIGRRFNSVVNWLVRIGWLHQADDRYVLTPQGNISNPNVEFVDITEPLLPQTLELQEYLSVAERTISDEPSLQLILRDEVKSERAIAAHVQLVNLVAERVRYSGSLPRSNALIDLASRVDNRSFIFEMKSIHENNARSQIRRGLSQLYEYRYLQNIPNAILVLVIENSLPNNIAWMQDYLEQDRDIRLVWDGDGQLHASPQTQGELAFLWS